MADLLTLVDGLWDGRLSVEEINPMMGREVLCEVADDAAVFSWLANVNAFRCGEALVLVDTGNPYAGERVFAAIRTWSHLPLHTAIFSHGHIDHVFGVAAFEAEAAAEEWAPPRVVAHEAIGARFDRYQLTAGWNAIINMRQFNVPGGLAWPTEYRYPDETYRQRKVLEVEDERIQLRHARGETDDHTWTWFPSRRVLCPGDLFIWGTPNAGNPQKVQRYPLEWAQALRAMRRLKPAVMLPGHGLPIVGEARIAEALRDTETLLTTLHDQTVALMNEGARLNDILHAVRAPAALMDKPYLHAIYDEPEFIVRNVWRLYGGWYDGNPAHLKPAPDSEVAAEIAALAGGAGRLAERARALSASGNHRLATHLAELAALADDAQHETRAGVLERRVEAESSLMAKGIYSSAARESRER